MTARILVCTSAALFALACRHGSPTGPHDSNTTAGDGCDASCQEEIYEYTFFDSTGNDLAGGELEAFFNTLSFGAEAWFYFEPEGNTHAALCTDHADFYVNHYLANLGAGGCVGATDATAAVYGRPNAATPFEAATAIGATYYCPTNRFHPARQSTYGAGLILDVAHLEDQVVQNESHDYQSPYIEAQSTMRFGASRLAVCGF